MSYHQTGIWQEVSCSYDYQELYTIKCTLNTMHEFHCACVQFTHTQIHAHKLHVLYIVWSNMGIYIGTYKSTTVHVGLEHASMPLRSATY